MNHVMSLVCLLLHATAMGVSRTAIQICCAQQIECEIPCQLWLPLIMKSKQTTVTVSVCMPKSIAWCTPVQEVLEQ
jgi:hypothetical protein